MSVRLFNQIKDIVTKHDGAGAVAANDAVNELTRLLLEEDAKPVNDREMIPCKSGPGYVHFGLRDFNACKICNPLVNESATPTRTSSTGAIRNKLLGEEFRFDLLDSNDSAMRRLAKVFALGFKKYGPDNWKKGFPNSEYYAHAREHMLAWASCPSNLNRTEDDIAHACWNLMAIMWNEEHLPQMCDFPSPTPVNDSIQAYQQKH